MAKASSPLGDHTGKIGQMVYYKRFGKVYARRLPESINDSQSEAQLCQRAIFKAMQHTAALLGPALQRGLTVHAHRHGLTEANMFARLNKRHFSYEAGRVSIRYQALLLSHGPLPAVSVAGCDIDGRQGMLTFHPELHADKARPDDVVHLYLLAPKADMCLLAASVERQAGTMAFELPDLSVDDEAAAPQPRRSRATKEAAFHMYLIVESAATAAIPTLTAAEKKACRNHRNIDRRVSSTVYVGAV